MQWLQPAQLIGYGAFAAVSFGFAQKDIQRLIRFHTFGTALFIIHYAWLGAWLPAGASGINVIRNLLIKRADTVLRKHLIIGGLVAAYTLNCVLTYHGWVSYVLWCASMVIIVAYFKATGLRQRFCLLTASLLWLLNNIGVHSIGGVGMEILNTGIHCTTIWRLLREQKIDAQLAQTDIAVGNLT